MALQIFINRGRVVASLDNGEDQEEISPEVKPEVVEYLRLALVEREKLYAEREKIDRRQEPDKFKAWLKKHQTWALEINSKANELQFG